MLYKKHHNSHIFFRILLDVGGVGAKDVSVVTNSNSVSGIDKWVLIWVQRGVDSVIADAIVVRMVLMQWV